MRASGTAQVFGATDPKGGKLDVKATGSISMALLHTFDPDVISIGQGRVHGGCGRAGEESGADRQGAVRHVNVAIDGVPNGLSDMNGTLVFNQDRLQVKNLTATTGGGKLKIGGSLRYQQKGIYADLTATGDVVRVRLYGLECDGECAI